MDPVRRLTLALLLASVAALGASVEDPPDDEELAPPPRAPSVVPLRVNATMVYDGRRCSERALNPYRRRPR